MAQPTPNETGTPGNVTGDVPIKMPSLTSEITRKEFETLAASANTAMQVARETNKLTRQIHSWLKANQFGYAQFVEALNEINRT